MSGWYFHPDNPNFDSEDNVSSTVDLKLIDKIVLGGIDTKDYPDFVDAFIESANYDGVEMTDEQIEWVNDEHSDFVHEAVFESLF